MPTPVSNYLGSGARSRFAITLLEKVVWLALGVLLPLVCFGIAAPHYPSEPEWQKGGWGRYIAFIPDGRAGFPFYPLLIYSMVSLFMLVIRPASSRLVVVRLGLYTGIVLGLQYTVIQAAALSDSPTALDSKFICLLVISLASNLVLVGILKVLQRIPKMRPALLAVVAAITIAAMVISGFIARGIIGVGRPFAIAAVLLLLVAPAWSVGIYAWAAFVARRLHRQSSGEHSGAAVRIASWIGWLIAYTAAWKWSITNAVAMYAALPTSAPGCYVATAATNGHPTFVGSTAVRAADGSVFHANLQLRRLKCVEIALMTVCPLGHRRVRRLYDFLGPRLADVISVHPTLADIAFALLKPVEWIAFGLLIAWVPQVRALAKTLYRQTC
jgi:hypothetical protein